MDHLLEQLAEGDRAALLWHPEVHAKLLRLQLRLPLEPERPRHHEQQLRQLVERHVAARALVEFGPRVAERVDLGDGDQLGVEVVQPPKVVEDDGDDQIEEDERGQHLERDEEGHRRGRAAVARRVGAHAAALVDHGVGHDR